MLFEWSLLGGFDAADIALQSCEHSNVWTDGSLVLDNVFGASSSGAGFYAIFLARLGEITSGSTLVMIILLQG